MSLVVADTGKLDLLGQLQAWMLANTTLRLFTNNHTPFHSDIYSTYTEATFAGYSAITLGSWGAAYLTADFHAFIDETIRTFTTSGAGLPQTIYGYYVTKGTTDLLWAELAATPVTLTAGGQTYTVLPRFSLTSEF
jgi:hypothetical protein